MNSLTRILTIVSLALLSPVLARRHEVLNSQVRLAYVGDTAMRVSWNTFRQLKKPTVHYGTEPDKLHHRASSHESVTYDTSLTYNNHVTIDGLEPDTQYYYLPGHLLRDNATTPPYTFRTSRPAGDMTPYSAAVIIDMGTMGPRGLTTSAGQTVSPNNILKPGEQNTVQSLENALDTYDLLLHPGDYAYADAWLKEIAEGFLPNTTMNDGWEVYESILNDYFDEMTPMTTTKPWMVGAGNHEANCICGGYDDPFNHVSYNTSVCSPGQTNFTGLRTHFRMPSDVGSGGAGNFWYSFDHGMVHYVMLDTETDLGHGFVSPDELNGGEGDHAGPFGAYANAQTDWLEADLKAVDRRKTPWVIAAGHRPWYLSLANVTHTICWMCKDVFEPLFLEYGVDLYISGHAHFYQRSAPLNDSVVDPNELNNPSAPWYITNGAAGHYDGLSKAAKQKKPYERFRLDENDATYGWSRLTFHNCTHMTHEFVASNNNTVLDSATLFKDRSCDAKSN
ncbi:metallo-phosphoesterase [Cordyceps fumosorosea ARSEF 2679]|uniref:Purple acid phosphatase n=1 Tax=Cordyceps fumosorosea (strain ARSEF 2679) TaxID=1081104 RepID=A0A167U952_CORFA|nr:metallo-phosphoesterase [Cordyceps fumosorosea ARSEF 2679]OAA61350.1 metallo-phosphoesterase [Cordyceps fumosorosea ARSEF 2679]